MERDDAVTSRHVYQCVHIVTAFNEVLVSVPAIAAACSGGGIAERYTIDRRTVIIRFIATHIHSILFNTGSAIQIQTVNSRIVASSVDTDRTVLQMPVHIGCGIISPCSKGWVDKERQVGCIQCNIAISLITTLDGGIGANRITISSDIAWAAVTFIAPYNTVCYNTICHIYTIAITTHNS